jgi:hypothetical protein
VLGQRRSGRTSSNVAPRVQDDRDWITDFVRDDGRHLADGRQPFAFDELDLSRREIVCLVDEPSCEGSPNRGDEEPANRDERRDIHADTLRPPLRRSHGCIRWGLKRWLRSFHVRRGSPRTR